MHYQLKAFK